MDDLNTVTKVFTFALTGLVGAVGFLFRTLWNKANEHSVETNRKLDACEDKHEKSNALVLELTSKVGELHGRFAEYDASKKELQELHLDVLKEIRRRNGSREAS